MDTNVYKKGILIKFYVSCLLWTAIELNPATLHRFGKFRLGQPQHSYTSIALRNQRSG